MDESMKKFRLNREIYDHNYWVNSILCYTTLQQSSI